MKKKKGSSDWIFYSLVITSKCLHHSCISANTVCLIEPFPKKELWVVFMPLTGWLLWNAPYQRQIAPKPEYSDTPWFPQKRDLEVLPFQLLQHSCRQGRRGVIEALLYILWLMFFKAVPSYHWEWYSSHLTPVICIWSNYPWTSLLRKEISIARAYLIFI